MTAGIVLTESLENYLEAIHTLSEGQGYARVTDVAAALGFSKPSVNRAIKTLREHGLLEHEDYGTIRLTDEGDRLAESVIRRHHLLKHFLADILKVEEAVAEEEACKLEHALSYDTTEKLSAYLRTVLEDFEH